MGSTTLKLDYVIHVLVEFSSAESISSIWLSQNKSRCPYKTLNPYLKTIELANVN